jgi:nucleoside-diphosphate-sugar epimerase
MSGLVAVTGATGFIGRHLIDRLAEEDWQIRALTRRQGIDKRNVRWVHGDLASGDSLDKLVDDVDVVIHCAGRVRGNSHHQFLQTNAEGTERLITSVLRQNTPPRVLLISSLAAREPDISWYANSKYQGERHLIKSGEDLDWSILRPTAVYGPGDREMAPLFNASRYGILPALGAPATRFGLLYVGDLVQAILDWLNFCKSSGKIYELDDGTPGGYDLNLVKTIASQAWGRPVHILSIPLMLVRSLAGINLGLSRVFHYSPMLTPGKVRELVHDDWVCDNNAFMNDTGWQPKITLASGISLAVLRD